MGIYNARRISSKMDSKKGDFMTKMMKWIEDNLFIPPNIQIQIFKTMFIILIMNALYSALRKLLYKTIGNSKNYYRAKKTASYTISIIIFILVGRVWFEGVGSVMTFLGLFSAALAVVMRDVILNLAGWIYIIVKSPFRVGDRIELDSIAGDVIDIQLFSFVLMEIKNWIDGDKYTGRIVYIPNSIIFNEALSNYNKEIPYIWNELHISINFESNWKKAKDILGKIANKHSEKVIPEIEKDIRRAPRMFSLFNDELESRIYTKIDNKAANITFVIRYICPYKSKRGSAEKIYEDILTEFMKHDDIEFAYPINKVYFDSKKGDMINIDYNRNR